MILDESQLNHHFSPILFHYCFFLLSCFYSSFHGLLFTIPHKCYFMILLASFLFSLFTVSTIITPWFSSDQTFFKKLLLYTKLIWHYSSPWEVYMHYEKSTVVKTELEMVKEKKKSTWFILMTLFSLRN